MNFAKAVNLAMRNGFANFRKVGCEFRNAKFRNRFDCETNEQCIGIANLKLALRNWHCEIRIANLALRNFRIAKLVCELTANFGNAKFRIGFVRGKFRKATLYWGIGFRNAKLVANTLRNSQWLRTVCENLLLLIFHAFRPVFNCISFSSLFL